MLTPASLIFKSHLNYTPLPLVESFTATQDAGEPSSIVLTDTSSGADAAITGRAVFLIKADGTYVVPTGTTTQYILWPIADTTLTLDVLTKDTALSIVVQWLDVSSNVLYDVTALYGFTLYGEIFDYGLTQMLSANQILINDNNFWPQKSKLRTLIDSGNQAVSLATDIAGAQVCYDLATAIRLSSQYYFNTNS